MLFAGGVTVEIAMSRRERFGKAGGRSEVTPATIHEDLSARDFTLNAIALSLNRASRGLPIDPTNGLGDLERKELRTAYNYALYDDPVRILRLVRFKVRLGFNPDERTQLQYENVRMGELEKNIAPRRLFEELRAVAGDPKAPEILSAFEQEKLLSLFSSVLTGPKLNLPGLTKLQKAKQLIAPGTRFPLEDLGIFLFFLTEKLAPKEEAAFIKAMAMRKAELDLWQKLEARAKKLERELKSAKLKKPSQVYYALAKAPGDEILLLLIRSQLRIVQDRIKNYLQKYLPLAQGLTEEEVLAAGGVPGTPKYQKIKDELTTTKLNARPKKPVPEEATEPPKPVDNTRLGPCAKPSARRACVSEVANQPML